MGKLIIVSNRISLPESKAEAGGLAVALNEALKERGGVWCGWSGKISDATEGSLRKHGKIQYLTFDFTEADYQQFYAGFCNSMLWPLFHYRLGFTQYTSEMYEGYERINARFAVQVSRIAEPGDTIWVHDYQLLTTGNHLRRQQITNRLGFFLHIPFPVPEVFSAMPHAKTILKGMCAYDLIGFQTETDLKAFIRCVGEMIGGHAVANLRNDLYDVQAFGRRFQAGVFPISIDTAELQETAETSHENTQTKQLVKSLRGRKMMIGVDRLDYTKGLVHRLEAYQQLLVRYPDYIRNVTYTQITPPSRTDVENYAKIRAELEGLAARVNGMHAEIDWVPIRYINKSFSRRTLAGFYRSAAVGLVTPLRDGMNLVAKEYVACQNPENPGMLVLSQFAGAAQELSAALLINPYDVEGSAEVIAQALAMPLEERKDRYQEMMRVLQRSDIFAWTRHFLHHLAEKREPIIIAQTPMPKKAASSGQISLN